jgi:hypothetical protein
MAGSLARANDLYGLLRLLRQDVRGPNANEPIVRPRNRIASASGLDVPKNAVILHPVQKARYKICDPMGPLPRHDFAA